MKRFFSILLALCICICLLPAVRLNADAVDELYDIRVGDVYYFDLSGESIPGTVNDALPDKTLSWVPFSYAGTMITYMNYRDDSPLDNQCRCLFVSDYVLTLDVSRNELDTAELIYGREYISGGKDYLLRAPAGGRNRSGESGAAYPSNNEWDRILERAEECPIKNIGTPAWAQDKYSGNEDKGVLRGGGTADGFAAEYASVSSGFGFRPVLELVIPFGIIDRNMMKTVSIDLNGGSIGSDSGVVKMLVKSGSGFKAPSSDPLTRPSQGIPNPGFWWLGSDGNLYLPGDDVPADVTGLTAQWTSTENYGIPVGATFWFDLSGAGIIGSTNAALPDKTLRWVPFTYAGTITAYSRTAPSADTNVSSRKHDLFIADYIITFPQGWKALKNAGLLYGSGYSFCGADYSLRAPSGGSNRIDEPYRGTPESNEWDVIIDKSESIIKNLEDGMSLCQDLLAYDKYSVVCRGSSDNARALSAIPLDHQSYDPFYGYRPVLEISAAGEPDFNAFATVSVDLNGGSVGGNGSMSIIVKAGAGFKAPSGEGITRPGGNTGDYFRWLGSNGKLYSPGESLPANITALTAKWTQDDHTVVLNTNGVSIAAGKNVTGYTEGIGAALPGAEDITRAGYIFTGWYENAECTGAPAAAISAADTGSKVFYAGWRAAEYTIAYEPDADTAETAPAADRGTVEAPAEIYGALYTRLGYTQSGWKTADGKEYSFGESYDGCESVTLYPVWRENDHYTVHLVNRDGTEVASYKNVRWTDLLWDVVNPRPLKDGYAKLQRMYFGSKHTYGSTMYKDFAANGEESITLIAVWDYYPGGMPCTIGVGSHVFSGYRGVGDEVGVYYFRGDELITINPKYPEEITYMFIGACDKLFDSSTDALHWIDYNAAEYTAPVRVGDLLAEEDKEYILFVDYYDYVSRVVVINTEKLVLDKTAPAFVGIENGKTYCGAQRVTVEEKHLESVTVNGVRVELGADNSFTLAPAGGRQTVVATDKAGNVTQITVTVEEESAPRMPGDVDGDGKITVNDCLYLKRYILGTYNGDIVLENADVNGNGKIDATDYLYLKRGYLGTFDLSKFA